VAICLPDPVPVPGDDQTVNGARGKNVSQTCRRQRQFVGVQGRAAVSRSRDVPPALVGGRKQPTRTPASRQAVAAAQRNLRVAQDHEHHCRLRHLGNVNKSQPVRVRAAAPASGRHGSAFSTRHRGQRGAHGRRCQASVEMNDRAASIRWARTGAGPKTRPPWLPSALDNVVVTTTSGATRQPSS